MLLTTNAPGILGSVSADVDNCRHLNILNTRYYHGNVCNLENRMLTGFGETGDGELLNECPCESCFPADDGANSLGEMCLVSLVEEGTELRIGD